MPQPAAQQILERVHQRQIKVLKAARVPSTGRLEGAGEGATQLLPQCRVRRYCMGCATSPAEVDDIVWLIAQASQDAGGQVQGQFKKRAARFIHDDVAQLLVDYEGQIWHYFNQLGALNKFSARAAGHD
jgi:hypothetical protein